MSAARRKRAQERPHTTLPTAWGTARRRFVRSTSAIGTGGFRQAESFMAVASLPRYQSRAGIAAQYGGLGVNLYRSDRVERAR
jgi:hypothetical protein